MAGVNPELAVPLAFGPAGAGFGQDQVLAVGVVHRYRLVVAAPGPAAVGVQDAEPESLFGVLHGDWVGGRVEGAYAPGELLVMQPAWTVNSKPLG